MKTDENNKEITVIGAGIIGICSAIELQKNNWKVRVVDPNEPGQVTSFGNAGVLSPWSCVPQSIPGLWKNIPKWLLNPEGPLTVHWLYGPTFFPWMLKFFKAGALKEVEKIADALLTLNQPTLDLYRSLLDGTGYGDLIRDSVYLHLYRNPQDASPKNFSWQLRLDRGISLSFIEQKKIQEIEPEISADFKAAVIIHGQGRCTNPGRLGTVLTKKAQELGVEFVKRKVERILVEPEGTYRLQSESGSLFCKQIVIAAGAWSVELLKSIDVKIPLEAERGYHLIFKDPQISVTNSIMDGDRKFVASSMDMGLRSAGTAEFSGLYSKPNYARAKIFKKLTKQLFPNLNTAKTEEWSGVRPSLPDTIPCIGRIPNHPNIITAFGHSHLGLTQAPMTAKIVHLIAENRKPNINITPFRPERFAKKQNFWAQKE